MSSNRIVKEQVIQFIRNEFPEFTTTDDALLQFLKERMGIEDNTIRINELIEPFYNNLICDEPTILAKYKNFIESKQIPSPKIQQSENNPIKTQVNQIKKDEEKQQFNQIKKEEEKQQLDQSSIGMNVSRQDGWEDIEIFDDNDDDNNNDDNDNNNEKKIINSSSQELDPDIWEIESMKPVPQKELPKYTRQGYSFKNTNAGMTARPRAVIMQTQEIQSNYPRSFPNDQYAAYQQTTFNRSIDIDQNNSITSENNIDNLYPIADSLKQKRLNGNKQIVREPLRKEVEERLALFR